MYVIKSISFYAKIPSTSYRNLYALYRPGNWYSICNEMMHHPSDSVVHFASVDFRCALDLQNRVVLPFDRLMARHWLVVQYTCKSFTFSSLFQFLIFPTNRRHRYKTVPCSDIKTLKLQFTKRLTIYIFVIKLLRLSLDWNLVCMQTKTIFIDLELITRHISLLYNRT